MNKQSENQRELELKNLRAAAEANRKQLDHLLSHIDELEKKASKEAEKPSLTKTLEEIKELLERIAEAEECQSPTIVWPYSPLTIGAIWRCSSCGTIVYGNSHVCWTYAPNTTFYTNSTYYSGSATPGVMQHSVKMNEK